ncbi:unnamed protein product [Urochloa decumbens]|uniref:Uncharacterized protein n=1 Tax=Urochloa decumbens TaxID=240449 RepID=A0ABC8YXQ5_9POAL
MEAADPGTAGQRGRALLPCGHPRREARNAAAPRCSSAPPRGRKDWTPRERAAAKVFLRAAVEDAEAYMAMTEADVVEEYRRAGKLHKYEPAKEADRRLARVIKKYPPPPGLVPDIDRYHKLLDDEED